MNIHVENWKKKRFTKKLDIRHITHKIKKKLSHRQAEKFHTEAFEKINCLECANCCKSIPPIITRGDSNRISKKLGIKESDFLEGYTTFDHDGDRVLNSSPCHFLLEDNTCFIYQDRPKACRRYPHTDNGESIKYPDLLMRNSTYCPAAFYIIQQIKEHVK